MRFHALVVFLRSDQDGYIHFVGEIVEPIFDGEQLYGTKRGRDPIVHGHTPSTSVNGQLILFNNEQFLENPPFADFVSSKTARLKY